MSHLNEHSRAEVQRIMAFPYFEKLGGEIDDSRVVAAESLAKAAKSAGRMDWLNTRIAWQNALTGQLSLHHRMEYRGWNHVVREVESLLTAGSVIFFDEKMSGQFPESFVKSARWEVVSAVLEKHFMPRVRVEYFSALLSWYERGHIPCGWDGEWPQGKLMVY